VVDRSSIEDPGTEIIARVAPQRCIFTAAAGLGLRTLLPALLLAVFVLRRLLNGGI